MLGAAGVRVAVRKHEGPAVPAGFGGELVDLLRGGVMEGSSRSTRGDDMEYTRLVRPV